MLTLTERDLSVRDLTRTQHLINESLTDHLNFG